MDTEPPSNGEAIWGNHVLRGRGWFHLRGGECPGKVRCVGWMGNYGDEVPGHHKRRGGLEELLDRGRSLGVL